MKTIFEYIVVICIFWVISPFHVSCQIYICIAVQRYLFKKNLQGFIVVFTVLFLLLVISIFFSFFPFVLEVFSTVLIFSKSQFFLLIFSIIFFVCFKFICFCPLWFPSFCLLWTDFWSFFFFFLLVMVRTYIFHLRIFLFSNVWI